MNERLEFLEKLLDEIDHERWVPVSTTSDDAGCMWCGRISTDAGDEHHEDDCVFGSDLWKQYKASVGAQPC